MHKIKFIGFTFLIAALSACGNKPASTDTQSASPTATATSAPSNKKNILFFGDSLTAGYGLSDPTDDMPTLQ